MRHMGMRAAALVLLTLAACHRQSEPQGAPDNDAAVASAESVSAPSASARSPLAEMAERAHGRSRREGGGDPVSFFIRTASEMPQSQAQATTLETLGAEREHMAEEARNATAKLKKDVVAGIHQGKLDAALIKKDETTLDQIAEARAAYDASAVNALHAMLDTVERKTFLDLVHARKDFWPGGNRTESADGGDAPGGPMRPRRLQMLTTDLDLDAVQQAKVDTIAAKVGAMFETEREQHRAHMESLVNAFSDDLFDAKTLLPAKESAPPDPAQLEVTFVSQVLPVLRADQREKFGRRVEQWSLRQAGGERGKGDRDGGRSAEDMPPHHP